LIPAPKHILINKDSKGNTTTELFREQQKSEDLMQILGYGKNSKIKTTMQSNSKNELQLANS
jgi:arginine decarboxylase